MPPGLWQRTGPQTVQPPAGTNLSTLNPCPLNVCCNICEDSAARRTTFASSQVGDWRPGTSAPGKNGCKSPMPCRGSATLLQTCGPAPEPSTTARLRRPDPGQTLSLALSHIRASTTFATGSEANTSSSSQVSATAGEHHHRDLLLRGKINIAYFRVVEPWAQLCRPCGLTTSTPSFYTHIRFALPPTSQEVTSKWRSATEDG